MKFKRSIISASLISILSACGGSSSSTTPSPVVEPVIPAPVPVKTVIQGKAIKGTISNAVVTVYKYVDGQALKLEAAELEAASIITEADGSYTVTVLDYDGPVKVELSVDENTTMMCDAPTGCGEVAYGAPIALSTVDPTLVLSAISTVGTDNAGTANLNVSALTHLAAALIEADDAGVNSESIQAQSSVIANAFNITGSLTELEPTTVDDPLAVASEENFDELRYGLINSGIMSALFDGTTTSDNVLSSNLASAVNDIVANDGALLVNQDDNAEGFELSLVDVLEGAVDAASAAAEAIAADPELSSNTEALEQLAQEETNLENQSEFVEANTGEDGRIDPVIEQPTEGDAIDKAKAMVADVRLFSHLFEVGSDSNTAITSEGEQYLTLIEDAGEMVEAEAASFLLLADVADALSEISMAYDAGTITEGTFPIGSFLSIEGAVGSITIDEKTDNGGMLFTISATSGDEKIALNAAVVFAEDGLSLNLNLDGSIESAGAMLSLSEGSFAKVNLGSAISRESLEDDSFEGEVVSGELSLEVILEQKTTDTVTNPVAFTGIIKTKLLPVTVHTLNEKTEWARDENGDLFRNDDGSLVRDENGYIIREFDRYGKDIDTKILPEMLTLSGGFSSLSGNLIKATFTVNIQDLENYEAPEFENIGAPVEDLLAVSVSDDKNTVTVTTNESVANGYTSTHTFTSGDLAGEWSSTVVREMNEEQEYLNSFIWEDYINYTMTRSVTDTNGMEGYVFTYHGTFQDSHNAYLERIVPIDKDGDNEADSYSWNYFWGYKIDEEGNLLNYDEEIVSLDLDSANRSQEYENLTELMKNYRLQPNSISNAAENFEFMVEHYLPEIQLELTSGARASIFYDENIEKVASISENSSVSLSGNVTLDLPIEDAFTIMVSADSTTVIIEDESFTRTYSSDFTSTGNFVFNRQVQGPSFEYSVSDIRTVSTKDLGLDVEEVTMFRDYTLSDTKFYQLRRFTPIDNNDDGLADYFTQTFLHSEHINSDGVLVNADGTPLEDNTFRTFDSWDDAEFHWGKPFNPFTVTDGLEAAKQWLTNARQSRLSTFMENIGDVELEISSEEMDMLVAESTHTFDAVNTHPDSEESLENEDVFLDINAALSLETMLGDYQVKLMLSGDRTALDDGKFDIDMEYKLPGEDAMRKFSVHMKTDEEGRLTASNSEGVLVVLKELEEGSDSNIIGTIVVGAAAEKVADIEDRDGIIMIVYTNGDSDTL